MAPWSRSSPGKIAVALMKAFLAVHGTSGAASASVRETVEQLTQNVVRALLRSRPSGGTFHIEDVQDQVELGLMRSGQHDVARAYVLYRERRAQERAAQGEATRAAEPQLMVVDGGERRPLDLGALKSLIASACENLGADVKPEPVLAETQRNLYDGVAIDEVYKAAILAARTLIEKDPGLQPRHRPPAAAHHPPRDHRRRGDAGRDAGPLRRVLSRLCQEGHQGRAAGREAGPVRPGQAGRRAEG